LKSDRNRRIEDFRRRAAGALDSVYHHRFGDWLYIPVHDFADETDSAVLTVDCWCLLGGDAAFLECAVNISAISPLELFARIDLGKPKWPKLFATLPGPLTRNAVEYVMQRFAELGFPDSLLSRLQPGAPKVRLVQ
jgi:hypothetical protein